MAINLENKHKVEIIRLVLSGEGHRPYMTALKSDIYINFYISFFEEISNHGQEADFEDIFIKNSDLDDRLLNTGINKKTVGDTYNSASREMKEKAIKEIGRAITEIIQNKETSIEEVSFKFKDNNEYVFNTKDFLKMILATSTNHAALKGGFASTFGKQVEKPLIKTICKVFGVSENNYEENDQQDNRSYSRETDFYIIDDDNNKFKVEFKMMGRGNPEGADSLYARDTSIFMGDTLSETNKKQCEDNGVHWIELRNNGWIKFGEVLESLNINYSFNKEYKENIEKIIWETVQ